MRRQMITSGSGDGPTMERRVEVVRMEIEVGREMVASCKDPPARRIAHRKGRNSQPVKG